MPTVIASGTKTADGTEQDLATDTTNQEYELNVDLGNMAILDVVELRIYGKVLSGGTERLVFLAVYGPMVPFEKIIKKRFLANIHVRATLKQTAGTNRDYPWSLLAVSGGGGASAADVADAVWDEAIAGHTSAGSFGAKNQKVVPSETIGDYKADVSALALEATLTAIKGSGWTTETLKAIKEYVDDLEGRLTATRAGYLDNLSAGAVALEATLTAIKGAGWSTQTLVSLMTEILNRLATSGYTAPDNADIVTLVGRLTATRAGYLDNLSAGAVALEGNVQGHAAAALTAYDPPTKAELDSGLSPLALESEGKLAAVKAKTDNLPASPAAVGSAMVLTSAYDAAKNAAPESGGNVAAIKAKTDNLPAAPAAVSNIPTTNQIADQVWDEVLAGHLTAGSCGAGLNAAGSAGDPWTTTLPGSYADGSAGKILGARLDAAITTRAPETGGNLAAVKSKTDNLPASPAATGDIPSAATIATTVWANATRTLTSFGTLVADIWANSARTLTSFGTLIADMWAAATRSLTDKAGFTISGTKQTLDVLHDATQGATKAELDSGLAPLALESGGKLAAVKAKTDNLPAAPAIEGNVQGHVADALAAYDPPTKAELDAGLAALNDITVGELLSGDMGDGVSFPANSLADRLRKLFWILCNRLAIVDATGAFTAYKGDGVTPGATGTIVDDATNTVRSIPTWP